MYDYWRHIWAGRTNYGEMDMTDAKTLDPQVLAEMSKEELRRLEREIARRHIEGLTWFMVFCPFANLSPIPQQT